MSSLLIVVLLFVIFYLIVIKEEPKIIYIEKTPKHYDHGNIHPHRHDLAYYMIGGRIKPKDALSGRRMTH